MTPGATHVHRLPYDSPAMDDAGLVRAAVAGDRAAFGDIYDRYADRVHAFATTVLRDPDEAADVTQDTFIVAARRLDQLRDPAKLRPWLFAIARHEAFRRAKKRQRHVLTDEIDDQASLERSAEDVVSGRDAASIVHAAAEGLTERDRAVLDLSLRHGLEGEELGAAMGISAGHASVLAGRVRDRVEKSLGALLVARLGRDDCVELQGVLGDWDGSFSPLVRKRVARHVEGCETCSATKRRVASPAALLSSVPLVAAPASLRSHVMGAYDAHLGAAATGSASSVPAGGSGTSAEAPGPSGATSPPGTASPPGTTGSGGAPGGEPDGGSNVDPTTAIGPSSPAQVPPAGPDIRLGPDGFPRSGPSKHKLVAAVAAAALLLVVLLGAGLALTSGDDDEQAVVTGEEQPDEVDVRDVERNVSVVQDAGPASEAPSTTLPLELGDAPDLQAPNAGGAAPGFVPPPAPPPTPPPDTTGPSLGFSASPSTIYHQNTLGCPTTSVITVTASDPSGIASLSSSPAGSGGGSSISVVVPTQTPPTSQFTVTVTAVDGVGNTTTRPFSIPVLPVTAPC